MYWALFAPFCLSGGPSKEGWPTEPSFSLKRPAQRIHAQEDVSANANMRNYAVSYQASKLIG